MTESPNLGYGCGMSSTTTTSPLRPFAAATPDPVTVGRLGERLPGVHRIAVLRGGGLGDLLFAVPALYALAAAYPEAEIVLLGSAIHAELLAGRPGPVDEVAVLPATHTEWSGTPDADEAEFVRRLRATPIDLAVQVHGGGAWSNPFLRQLNPRLSVGSRAAGAAPLHRNLPYRYYQHEMLRALEVAGLAGAPPVLLEPRLPLTEADRAAASAALGTVPEPVVVVHPGASDPRRCWPTARFAEIARHCLSRGATVVLVGGAADRRLVADIEARVAAASNGDSHLGTLRTLVGSDLSTLCGVLARADVLVGNDSGPRHLARALGTPTVGVFWIGNVISAGPLSRGNDRVLMSWVTRCPVCDQDVTDEHAPRCPHDDSFVATVPVGDVRAEVDELLGWG